MRRPLVSDNPQNSQGRPSSPFARTGGPGNQPPIYRAQPSPQAQPSAQSAASAQSATPAHSMPSAPQSPAAMPQQPTARRGVPETAGAAAAGGAAAGGAAAGEGIGAKLSRVAAKVKESLPRTDDATSAAPAKRTRKARLRLSRVDPWSVMKTTLMFSIAFGILTFVAVWVLWAVLQSSGAFDSINKGVNDLLSTPGNPNAFDLGRYITGSRVLGYTALIAAADVIIFTALATLFSFLYNLSATVLGGLEVTLAED